MRRIATVFFMALSTMSVSGCGGSGEEPDVAVSATSQAFTPAQPDVRRNIHQLTPAERVTLRDVILLFITQPVLDEHATAHDWHHPAVGELFFTRHHDYLNQLEGFMVLGGHSSLIPVPEWDPGTPIPSEFLVADPLVTQAPMNPNPNQPIPSQLADSELCNFQSASDLAVSAESWHDGVHGAVGGAMASVPSAPGAPIFWLWHGLLDDMYHERTWRCETLPALLPALLVSLW